MAVFRLQVFYQRSAAEKWSNVYHIQAGDLPEALAAVVDTMVPGLLSVLHIACTIQKVLVSSLTDDTFVEAPVLQGGANGDTNDLMPLFNSAKVLFATVGLGRPDYKFLKGTLTDDANESGFIASSVRGLIDTVFTDIINDLATDGTPLVSENGDQWGAVSVQDAIQMRQMHRRRRRVAPTP
jgi:hypothetical protein